MKSSTNPALALLVGTLVLGQMNGPDAIKGALPGGTAQQAVNAEGLAGSITNLINELKPKAAAAVGDLLKDIKEPGASTQAKTHYVAGKPASKPQPKAEEKPPLPRHIRFAMPPPPPIRTPEEAAKIQAQRDMYERVMSEREAERAAGQEGV
nr:hypothetical protein [uncultured Roseateles sp.]